MNKNRGDTVKFIDLENLYYQTYILPNINKAWELIPPLEIKVQIESTPYNKENLFFKLWKESQENKDE